MAANSEPMIFEIPGKENKITFSRLAGWLAGLLLG